MAKTRPKTAEELCVLVESLLATMPINERQQFWKQITNHPSNWYFCRFSRVATEAFKTAWQGALDFHGLLEKEHAQLKKHRNPIRNAERDAEIMSFYRSGKKAPAIHAALRVRYPGLSVNTVNRVISTERNRPPSAD